MPGTPAAAASRRPGRQPSLSFWPAGTGAPTPLPACGARDRRGVSSARGSGAASWSPASRYRAWFSRSRSRNSASVWRTVRALARLPRLHSPRPRNRRGRPGCRFAGTRNSVPHATRATGSTAFPAAPRALRLSGAARAARPPAPSSARRSMRRSRGPRRIQRFHAPAAESRADAAAGSAARRRPGRRAAGCGARRLPDAAPPEAPYTLTSPPLPPRLGRPGGPARRASLGWPKGRFV